METSLLLDVTSSSSSGVKCSCCRSLGSSFGDPIDPLVKCTNFTRREIKMIYQNYKQSCPDGQLDVDIMKDVFLRFYPCGNTSQYASHVFRTMDHDNRGKVCFKVFIKWLSRISRGGVEDKLRWIFELYDTDSDGIISKNDLMNVIRSIYLILGRRAEMIADQKYLKEKTDNFFQRFDIDGDGYLSLDEFLSICSKDEQVIRSLEHFYTII